MSEFNKIRGVFFDWDGTLVDSLPLLFAAHNHAREELGFPRWTREEYTEAIVFSTRELYPRLYGDRAQYAMDILYGYIRENHLSQLSVMDGAEDVLKLLLSSGIAMGLVSNKRDDILKREVEHLGWQKYFPVYIGAGVATHDKPSGEPLLHALRLHPAGLTASDIVYVGDTESDLSCAAEAGCPVVYIRHETGAKGLAEKYHPDWVIETLQELKKVLMDNLPLPKAGMRA